MAQGKMLACPAPISCHRIDENGLKLVDKFWATYFMSQYLSISRAARVVGVPRNTLQSKIKAGELASFDGMLAVDELLRVFPQAKVEDTGMLERVNEIKDQAFGRRVFERALPDKEVLAERLLDMGRELAAAKSHLSGYSNVLEWLSIKMREAEESGGDAAQAVLAPIRHWLGRALVEELAVADELSALMLKDSLLRIMEAHVSMLPSGREFVVEGSESILQSALRAGLSVNYGCRDGSCGQCIARVVSGKVKKIRPFDFVLSDAEIEAGCTLMCAHTAVTDLDLEAREARNTAEVQYQWIEAKAKGVTYLPGDIVVLQVNTPPSARFRFLAGQSATVRANGFTAELPIASCPCEEKRLEFHFPRQQLPASLYEGASVDIEGPLGDFILRADLIRPLMFIAYGTGFAPIKSLVEHALALDALEPLHLYWLAPTEQGIYLSNLCRAWADALDNFSFTPIVGESSGAATKRIANQHPDLFDFDIYLAAPENELTALQAGLLAAGVDADRLFISRSAEF
jgi:CDP-4-dehydro-6-deoxyglucose reductase